MTNIQNIVDKVYDRLATDTGGGGFNHATTGIAGRIYAIEGKQNAAFPHMTFEVESPNPERNMGSSISYDFIIRLNLWGNKDLGSDVLMDLEQKAFARLEGQSLAPTGFDRALCTFNSRCDQAVEEDSIRLTDELRIRATAV